MADLWDTDSISADFAAAAIDPDRWTRALASIARQTGSEGAVLLPLKGQVPFVPASDELGGVHESYFRDGWHMRDLRYKSLQAALRKGVAVDLDFATVDQIRKEPYYQEFLAPFRLEWFAGVIINTSEDVWMLSIQRSPAQGPFGEAEQARLAQLGRSFASAAAVGRSLGFARADAALDAFDISGSAVVMLDRLGQVFRLNAAAEGMLGPDLQIVRSRLASWSRDATATLDAALHQLLWSRQGYLAPRPIALPRRQGRPLLAYLLRLPGVSAGILAPCQAVVALVDPDASRRPQDSALRICFGLTAAEARLASRLGCGDSIEAAAQAFGISAATARHQLKSIFLKTSTHRQSELVGLISLMIARSPLEDPSGRGLGVKALSGPGADDAGTR